MSATTFLRPHDLLHQMKGLGMAAGVMHIGAHPDDEDIGVMSYLSFKHGVKCVYWAATRGEGGQNWVGPYADESLGIFRTWEALAAREVDGSRSFYGPFYDFGYSKTALDAFAKWGEESIVFHLVRAIRILRPAILISRWRGTAGDLHGHHQAIGLATYKAFDAAGDPEKHPELTQAGIPPWKPLKLYHSTDNSGGDYSAGAALNLFGSRNEALERDGILRLNTGEFDPTSGLTYQERAWLAYNKHQTQAIGMAPNRGDFFYYFSLYKSHVETPEKERSLFDGFDPSLTGLADVLGGGNTDLREKLDAAGNAAQRAVAELPADNARKCSSTLVEGLRFVREAIRALERTRAAPHLKLSVRKYLEEKAGDFERAVASSMNLRLDGTSDRLRITPGQKFTVDSRLWSARDNGVEEPGLGLEVPKGWEVSRKDAAGDSESPSARFEVTVPQDARFTTPYWLREERKGYSYAWPGSVVDGDSFDLPEVRVRCRLKIGGQDIEMSTPVVRREGFPGGFREIPVMVVPPIVLTPKSRVDFRPITGREQTIEISVTGRNNTDSRFSGRMSLVLPPGWRAEPASMDLSLENRGDAHTGVFHVTVPAEATEGAHTVRCNVNSDGRDYSHDLTSVRQGMPGIPGAPTEANCIQEMHIVFAAEIRITLVRVDWASKLRYAYVPGETDGIRPALSNFGVAFKELTDADLDFEDLGAFDVIVVGPNGYLLREGLQNNHNRLLDYVKDGGTLVVQFQGYGFQGKGYTPYPFKYSQPHDRVTLETAKVTMLDPEHVLFNFPNRIDSADFDGWIKDRGMYFFREYDKAFTPLLSCADPGEEQQKGGLLVSFYGRGAFLYSGYSFFKQIPAGVPGAFRLFANMLAIPAARLQQRIRFLRNVDFFSELADDSLEPVARLMEIRHCDDGEVICTEGEPGDELFLIRTGAVEVLKDIGGTAQKVSELGAGTCVGEMAILGNVNRTATLRAKGDAELLVIRGKDFNEVLGANPGIAIRLLGLLVRRLAK